MKKIALLTATSLVFIFNSYGQGYLGFNSGPLIFENFSSGTLKKSSENVFVTLLWSANTNVIPTWSIAGPTTNNFDNNWSGILTDPNFSIATTNGSATLIAVTGSGVVAGTIGKGMVPIAGTSPGQAIALYVLGWSSAYANPFSAAASGSVVGWSNLMIGTLGNSTTLNTLTSFGMQSFDLLVPEPTSFSLAGFGGLVLWLFRRKK